MGKKLKTSVAKSMAESFISDKKNANKLVELIGCLENEADVPACLVALYRIFSHLIDTQAMKASKDLSDGSNLSAADEYTRWLCQMYADTQCKLIELLYHPIPNIQELSLSTLMKLVKAEGQNPWKPAANQVSLPVSIFANIIRQLLSCDRDMTSLITKFQEFMEYDDIRYHTMKTAIKHLSNKTQQAQISTKSEIIMEEENISEENVCNLTNVFTMLDTLSMPSKPPEDNILSNFLSKYPEETTGLAINSYKSHKKLFSELWLSFLGERLSTGLYKKVLVVLHEKVIPHMENPLLLSDFLTTSYNVGGAISLLALNGLFILVNTYNLDYPDFYRKLYGLLEPSVFYVRYKARFFYLTDLFLTSTHLPAYLVAAFIKRLARLSLTAPPSGVVIIVPFIYNLLIRHPSCGRLVHCKDTQPISTDLSTDPFNNDEPDPSKCKALESSLWEVKTLQEHYLPLASREARKGENPLPRMETDISDLLETTGSSLFQQEVKGSKKMKKVSTTFSPPSGLFGNKEDQLSSRWTWVD